MPPTDTLTTGSAKIQRTTTRDNQKTVRYHQREDGGGGTLKPLLTMDYGDSCIPVAKPTFNNSSGRNGITDTTSIQTHSITEINTHSTNQPNNKQLYNQSPY
jgi:hypothetical protein